MSPPPTRFLPALESVRGLAAVYVVLHHISSNVLGLRDSLLGQPFRFGEEAVLVFFLLSGFVISHATESHGAVDWKRYAWLRVRRIYPVFLAALLLAYSVACIRNGEWLFPDWKQLLGNLVMIQDVSNKPGVWVNPFAENSPLWSLAYESTFYLLYIPLMLLVGRSAQLLHAALISCAAVALNQFAPNPWCNFASFFIVWWTGVEMARQYREQGVLSFRRQAAIAAAVLPLFLFHLFLCWQRHWQIGLADFPFYQARLYGDTMVALLVLPLLQRSPLKNIGAYRPLVWLGGISYALYAFHYPIVGLLPTLSGVPRMLDLGLKLAGLFLLAFLFERKLQPWINARTESIRRRRRPPLQGMQTPAD